MKLTNKKAYISPETGILSLELQGATMTNPASQFGHTDADPNTGIFHAPSKLIYSN